MKYGIRYGSGIYTINEGGHGITVSFQPWNWLRVYVYGKVFEVGGFSPVKRVERQIDTFSELMTEMPPYTVTRGDIEKRKRLEFLIQKLNESVIDRVIADQIEEDMKMIARKWGVK